MKYTDPDGMVSQVYQDDYGNLSNDPYAITGRNMGEPLPYLTDTLSSIAESHLNEDYSPKNSCDEWVAKLISEAGLLPSKYTLGNTKETVKQHINDLNKSGGDYSKTEKGKAYVVFMGDGTKSYTKDHEHAGLAVVNSDGSVNFYHSSRGNKDKKSTVEKYNSISNFEKDFAYSKFYYQELKKDEE